MIKSVDIYVRGSARTHSHLPIQMLVTNMSISLEVLAELIAECGRVVFDILETL